MSRPGIHLAGLAAMALAVHLAWASAGEADRPAAGPPGLSANAPPTRREPNTALRQLSVTVKPWKGDFDQMIERRTIRVLVPYSRTLYYGDRGAERGITVEILREWERDLNRQHTKQLGKRPVTLYVIPTTQDKLISGVMEGHGDIAAGNITATEARAQLVDFVAPTDIKAVNEIVVAGPKAAPVKSVEDLSGKAVHVRKTTSYHESLVALNERFAREGKPPVKILLLPDALEDEDVLDLLNVGLLDLVVMDDWVARIWAPIHARIRLVPDAVLRSGGQTGWAIRKNSPKLFAAIMDYYERIVKKQGLVSVLKARAVSRVKQLRDNTEDTEVRRYQETIAIFRKYGAQYNFDPVMVAAQGYQESRLDQTAKSHVGAIGVMQVMPATGAALKVGDIRVTDANIHAGIKYLDQLMTRHFPDAHFSETDRSLFAFASYNAGPGNIFRMRKLASERGLDPDKWFNNVEIVTSEKIGIETTTYVRNIYKYYVTYKLILEQRELQEKLKEQLKKGG